MAKLTAQQIASVALSAGVPQDQLAKAVAIALAESGGDPNAHNRVPPDNSYGLWQINMLGSLGPDRRRKLGIATNEELFVPAVNARAMMMISNNGKSWTPWTTYTRGTYLQHMSEANAAAGSPATTVGLPGGETFDNIKKAVQTLTDSGTWLRVVFFLAGIILIIMAIFRLTGNNEIDAVKSFQKVAKGAV